jgi:tetratricopeptide (TPR) repeat protein
MIDDDYFDSLEFKELLDKYELSMKTGDSIYLEPDDFTTIGEYYQAQGLTDKAIKAVEYAIQMFPGSINPLLLRSRIALLSEENIDKAKEYAEQIEDKTDLDYYYLIAEIMLVEGKKKEAGKYLEDKYNKIEEDDVEDYVIDVSNLYLDYGYAKDAENWYKLLGDKTSSDTLELEGRIAQLKSKFRKSEGIYRELVERDPYCLNYWNQLATLQFTNNRIHESIQSSEFAIAINPNDAEAYINKANGLFTLSNYEEALEYYKRASELQPDNISCQVVQGAIYLHYGKAEEAVAHFSKGLQLAGNNSNSCAQIYHQLAFAYARLGDMEKSLDCVDKIAKIENLSPNDVLIIKGSQYLMGEKDDEAIKCFSTAIKDSNEKPEVLQSIGLICYDYDCYELSYQYFLQLFKVAPRKWKTEYAYMAKCCKILKYRKEYLKYLRMACRKNPAEVATVFAEELSINIKTTEYYNYLKDDE